MHSWRRFSVVVIVILLTHLAFVATNFAAIVVKRKVSTNWVDASNVTIIDSSIYFNSIMQQNEQYWIYSGDGLGDQFVPDDIELITSSLNSALEHIQFSILIAGPQDLTHPRYNSSGARNIGTSTSNGIQISATNGRIVSPSQISGNCWSVALNNESSTTMPTGSIGMVIGGNILGNWNVNGIDNSQGGILQATNIDEEAVLNICKQASNPITCAGDIAGTIYLNGLSSTVSAINISSSAVITMNTLSGSIRANGNIDGTIDIGTVGSAGEISADYENNNTGDITGSITIDAMYGNIHGANLHTINDTTCGILNNINFDTGSKICGTVITDNNDNRHTDACDFVYPGNAPVSDDCDGNNTPDECDVAPVVTLDGITAYGTNAYARAIASGDFNSDGHMDIAVAVYGNSKIMLYENNGQGVYTNNGTTQVISSPISGPQFVVTGCFDRRSSRTATDIAVANTTGNYVTILHNNGNWSFSSATVSYPSNTKPDCLAVADWDQDGDLDLVTANYGTSSTDASISVLRNDGTGTFTRETAIAFSGYRYASGVIAADMNSDSYPDIAVACRGTNDSGTNILVLLNNGQGRFSSYSAYDASGPGPYSVASGDFDGDGDQDLVVSNTAEHSSYDGVVAILENNGSGVFSMKRTYTMTGVYLGGITVADLDGDGMRDDIAVVAYKGTSGKVIVFQNYRNASTDAGVWLGFQQAGAELASGMGPIELCAVATSPDPYHTPDLAVACYTGNQMHIIHNVTERSLADKDMNNVPDNCLSESCYVPPQDTNGDLHVDAIDFDTFSACYNGPTSPYKPHQPSDECVCMDSNSDAHMDAIDYDAFSECYNGPVNPPKPRCMGSNWMMIPTMLAQSTMESESREVAFDLQSEQAGQSLTAGAPVAWNVAVAVTGTSNGLAGYSLSLALHQGTASGPLVGIMLAMPTFSDSFHVGENGFTALYNPLAAGGPLMVGMVSTGSNTMPGEITGIGAGYGMPWTYTFAETRMTWGIGLDSRKAALLDSTSADYVLNSGTIDTTGLSPGHYVLTLTPQWTRVLRDDLNFEQDIEQSFMRPAHSISEPDTVEFDIAQ